MNVRNWAEAAAARQRPAEAGRKVVLAVLLCLISVWIRSVAAALVNETKITI
jgi:hypothetical protein